MFIDTRTSSLITPISGLQPLERTTNNPNNAANAAQFAAICRAAGLGADTCISDMPSFTLATTCSPEVTDIPNGATGKCYRETLSCSGAGWRASLTNYVAKCAASPNWVAWTKFR